MQRLQIRQSGSIVPTQAQICPHTLVCGLLHCPQSAIWGQGVSCSARAHAPSLQRSEVFSAIQTHLATYITRTRCFLYVNVSRTDWSRHSQQTAPRSSCLQSVDRISISEGLFRRIWLECFGRGGARSCSSSRAVRIMAHGPTGYLLTNPSEESPRFALI